MHACIYYLHKHNRKKMYPYIYSVLKYVPILVGVPSAIAITTHILALLSGRTVQVTVMECSVLFSLGVTSVATASVTDGATGMTNVCTYYNT